MRLAAGLAVLVAALLGSGCAARAPEPLPPAGPSSSTPSASSSAGRPSGTTDTPVAPARTVTIGVTGTRVSPAPTVVEVGVDQTLRLVVTINHDDTLHAHGFDVETDLTAGRPETIDLRGAEPGRYEVETHHPALALLVVQVR